MREGIPLVDGLGKIPRLPLQGGVPMFLLDGVHMLGAQLRRREFAPRPHKFPSSSKRRRKPTPSQIPEEPFPLERDPPLPWLSAS
jgi:hypothetical protein